MRDRGKSVARIGLIGAGVISRTHAEALRTLGNTEIAAIVDSDAAAAARLARSCSGAATFSSVEAALAADAFDRAHVLVPPPQHAEVTAMLLAAGKPVLVEKPLAADSTSAAALLGAAAQSGAALGVNQNFVNHPAFARLRRLVEGRVLGKSNFVSCIYNVPLRQLQAGQFGHWMFRAPVNILLEQAVHPLSQLTTLAGTIDRVEAVAGPTIDIGPNLPFVTELTAVLTGRNCPAQLRFAIGQSYPFWQVTVVGDDGVAVADMLANRVFTYRRTRWLEPADAMLSGLYSAGQIAGDSVRNLTGFGLATLRLARRNDAFFTSMRRSIAAFHAAVDDNAPLELDGTFGAGLVTLCETIAAAALPAPRPASRPAVAQPAAAPPDVAVIGGTGFIGRQVVAQLVALGHRVAVMARNTANLPPPFDSPQVTLYRGDSRDRTMLARAIGEAPVVVNLAHGGGSGSWDEVRDAMVGGAQAVAETCLDRDVRRLVHVSSIAALYLGDRVVTVTGATAIDPRADSRADYARAKAVSERLLLGLQARNGLRLCLLRPGVVVGAGTSPFHSGLGLFNNEQHCIGWNRGTNPLPFVLVEDVAAAVVRACFADGVDGRCYNLVGSIRPSARGYIGVLAAALDRPLRFHPQSPWRLWLVDYAKWLIKKAAGGRMATPSLRDLRSRGLLARFDCQDAERDLDWHPVADDETFWRRAIAVDCR